MLWGNRHGKSWRLRWARMNRWQDFVIKLTALTNPWNFWMRGILAFLLFSHRSHCWWPSQSRSWLCSAPDEWLQWNQQLCTGCTFVERPIHQSWCKAATNGQSAQFFLPSLKPNQLCPGCRVWPVEYPADLAEWIDVRLPWNLFRSFPGIVGVGEEKVGLPSWKEPELAIPAAWCTAGKRGKWILDLASFEEAWNPTLARSWRQKPSTWKWNKAYKQNRMKWAPEKVIL